MGKADGTQQVHYLTELISLCLLAKTLTIAKGLDPDQA